MTSKAFDNATDANRQQGGRRNIAYNGAMNIWQRGTSADTATSGDYMCDRWLVAHGGLDGNVDWDQETASTPDGFGYALKVSTDASETSLDAADTLTIQQRFEGQDLQQLLKGTSGAKSLTLSFWVKSSVASTYTAELFDGDNSRVIGKSYTISSADTWEFKTVTFEGDTTGAFDNDNLLSLYLIFHIDAGSDYTSGTFSTAWQANDNTERVYDTTGWLESTTPTFYITGVQLEVGTVATPFEHRSYGEELALCQRYYTRLNGGNLGIAFVGYANLSSQLQIVWQLPTLMRTGATSVDYTDTQTVPGTLDNWEVRMGANRSVDSISYIGSQAGSLYFKADMTGTPFTTGNAAVLRSKASNTFIAVDVEL